MVIMGASQQGKSMRMFSNAPAIASELCSGGGGCGCGKDCKKFSGTAFQRLRVGDVRQGG